jgi:hypothetical protein
VKRELGGRLRETKNKFKTNNQPHDVYFTLKYFKIDVYLFRPAEHCGLFLLEVCGM